LKGAFAEMPPAPPHPANLAGLGATGAVRAAATPLFTPFACGTLRLRNRIAMAPMTRWHSPGGVPGSDVADYYARRARGGAGLILTEGVNIDHTGASGYDDVPALFDAGAGRGWRAVVDAVHAAGAAIIPQLWHVGAFRRPGVGPNPAAPGFGPARIVEHGKTVVRRLDRPGIEAIIASYARAARVAVEMGFDGIEIHGAHGYLLDQFFWSQTNRRRDEHGGAIENRARFAAAVVAGIREQIPPDMPLIFRFSQWKMNDYQARIAETPVELARLLTPLCEAGVDIFHASTRRFWEPVFAGSPRSLARWTRDLTGRPVIAVGSVGLNKPHQSRAQGGHEAAIAEVAGVEPVLEGLATGDFDLIAVGRAMLADAEWANKVRRGRLADIAPLRPHHLKELT
jgi:2,4-dienoyl-CoA reductase-like NADH-dependent reductase (Old Yellow Enzyme family)